MMNTNKKYRAMPLAYFINRHGRLFIFNKKIRHSASSNFSFDEYRGVSYVGLKFPLPGVASLPISATAKMEQISKQVALAKYEIQYKALISFLKTTKRSNIHQVNTLPSSRKIFSR